MDGVKIYDARIRGGKSLAKSYPVEADLVTGVPESGIPAAKGYSEESGIPFGFAFYKNSYIGRTFIKPTQKERESSVHLKLSVLDSAVKGKRIVLVDDSIVRGTTIANLIRMLKKAGALEVHVRISSPPFLTPINFLGLMITRAYPPFSLRAVLRTASSTVLECTRSRAT